MNDEDLKPANENPWYILMTLYGEQEGDEVDFDKARSNRRLWNGWACQNWSLSERQVLARKQVFAETTGISVDETQWEGFVAETVPNLFHAEYLRRNGCVCKKGVPSPTERCDLTRLKFGQKIMLDSFVFPSLDFSGSLFVEDVTLLNAEFRGIASFIGAKFNGKSQFNGARFWDDASFSGAAFRSQANFSSARFRKKFYSIGAKFAEKASFMGASFKHDSWLNSIKFESDAVFDNCQFDGKVWLNEAIFGAGTKFEKCKFASQARLNRAKFAENANFSSTEFLEDCSFTKGTFEGKVDFSGAIWRGAAYFRDVCFEQTALFNSTNFYAKADFSDTTFSGFVDFSALTDDSSCDQEILAFGADTLFENVKFRQASNFSGRQFGSTAELSSYVSFANAAFNGPTSFEKAVFFEKLPVLSNTNLPTIIQVSADRRNWPTTPNAIDWMRRRLPDRWVNAEQFKAAAATLRHAMSRQTLPEEEHFFFRYEMHAASLIGGFWQRLPYGIFGLLSNFGYSILRPVLWLLSVIVVFWLAYTFQFASDTIRRGGEQTTAEALALSFSNTFSFFGFQRLYFGVEYIRELPTWMRVAGACQTIAGFILLFFLGLGLRTRFRLR